MRGSSVVLIAWIAGWLGVCTVAAAAPPPPTPASARAIEAAPDGVVEFREDVSVSIVGWSKPRVEVTSRLPDGRTVKLEGDGKRTRVRISGPPVPPGSGTLVVRVPKRSEVHITTRTGDVEVSGLEGSAIVETLSADIEVHDRPRALELVTTSGDIEVAGVGERLHAASVSGDVVVANASGRADIETISGKISIDGVGLTGLRASTVSGNIASRGPLAGKGPYGIETNSGDVDVRLPAASALAIVVDTFSGRIKNGLSSATASGRHFELQVGKGGPTLRVATFSGDVHLRKR